MESRHQAESFIPLTGRADPVCLSNYPKWVRYIGYILLILQDCYTTSNHSVSMPVKSTRLFLIIPLLMITFFLSCNRQKKSESGINEGYIEYRLEYKGDSMRDMMHQFLPKTMRMYFRDNNTKNSISDVAGIVEFTHIKNHSEGTYITLVDLFDKKYKYVEKGNSNSIIFQSRPGIQIESTRETKSVAGYLCRKINVHYNNSTNNKHNHAIYATRDIHIEGFTELTPYQSVEGVLLEFQVEIYELPIKMVATRVVGTTLPEDAFTIPSGYKKVNKQTMKRIIELLK